LLEQENFPGVFLVLLFTFDFGPQSLAPLELQARQGQALVFALLRVAHVVAEDEGLHLSDEGSQRPADLSQTVAGQKAAEGRQGGPDRVRPLL